MPIFTYTFIHKNNLISLYNVAGMHIFRADRFVLDNQLMCSSLKDYIFPSLYILHSENSSAACRRSRGFPPFGVFLVAVLV